MIKRVHNIVFAILMGIILGVTAYVLYARMPSVGASHYIIEVPRRAESKEKNSSLTERMLERGELSDHEARYWKVLKK